MRYVPSPIDFKYARAYAATANTSGRMQYYRYEKGGDRERISRTEFIEAYNTLNILAIKPIKAGRKDPYFQLEFYI